MGAINTPKTGTARSGHTLHTVDVFKCWQRKRPDGGNEMHTNKRWPPRPHSGVNHKEPGSLRLSAPYPLQAPTLRSHHTAVKNHCALKQMGLTKVVMVVGQVLKEKKEKGKSPEKNSSRGSDWRNKNVQDREWEEKPVGRSSWRLLLSCLVTQDNQRKTKGR